MKKKYLDFYIDVAIRASQLSDATRLKVGAVLVKDNDIISYGWNGQPIGYPTNICEHPDDYGVEFITDDTVIHAENNCILHAARKGISTVNSVLVVTHSPCWNCSKQIIQSGITDVYYKDAYRVLGKELIDFYDIMKVNLVKI